MWRKAAIVVVDRHAWSSNMERTGEVGGWLWTGRAAENANVSSTMDGKRSLYRPAKGSSGRDSDRMCNDDGFVT